MKRLIIAHLLVLLLSPAHAQNISNLQESFWSRLYAIEIQQEDKLDALHKSYITALERLIEDYQKSGKLEEILMIRGEIAKIRKDDIAETENPETKEPKELLPLQKKYLEARRKIFDTHAAEAVTLHDRAKLLLEEQIVALTKAGKIEEAVKVKTSLEKIMADKFIIAALSRNDTISPAVADWTSLTTAEMEIVENGLYDVGWLAEPENDKKQDSSEWGKAIRAQANKKPALLSHPNCSVRFKFRNYVTQFRTKLSLAHANGNVTYVILANGSEIKRETLSGSVRPTPMECTFPKTKEIVLQVHNNGAMDYDWASWINPEVR